MSQSEVSTLPVNGDYMYWRKKYHQVSHMIILSQYYIEACYSGHSKIRTLV